MKFSISRNVVSKLISYLLLYTCVCKRKKKKFELDTYIQDITMETVLRIVQTFKDTYKRINLQCVDN